MLFGNVGSEATVGINNALGSDAGNALGSDDGNNFVGYKVGYKVGSLVGSIVG